MTTVVDKFLWVVFIYSVHDVSHVGVESEGPKKRSRTLRDQN